MNELAMRLWREEEGQAVLEYALLLVLVTLAAVSSMRNLASTVSHVYSNATADLTEPFAPAVRADSDQLYGSGQTGTSSGFGRGRQYGSQDKMHKTLVKKTLQ